MKNFGEMTIAQCAMWLHEMAASAIHAMRDAEIAALQRGLAGCTPERWLHERNEKISLVWNFLMRDPLMFNQDITATPLECGKNKLVVWQLCSLWAVLLDDLSESQEAPVQCAELSPPALAASILLLHAQLVRPALLWPFPQSHPSPFVE